MNLERIERSVGRYKKVLKENEQCLVFLKGPSGGSYIVPNIFTPKEIDHFKKVWGELGAEFRMGWEERSELIDMKPLKEAFECFLDLTLELSWT